ncbi:hypothetical protein V1227_20770 [Lentzea sp. DG1S-22]|uniref:hypothetical protein n=1 Tax=unclassified Lentzea TaxID=2643253 RepID=UPI0027DF3CF8|nr:MULTISPECIES: hypothetical protein [unclassified Lentzea]MCG8926198.1 hypothetical protein [Lentzea sp. CC55]WVH77556.1 hypothetical protein V1227_20770 [Lentzea sp. DG1S-22]
MGTIVWVVVLVLLVAGVFYLVSQSNARKARELDDAKAEARRWVERLGGQVMSLTGSNAAATQAMADASERFTAAGSQMEQARTIPQARLVTETAMEGLHYVRAAREAMGMDPGPALPESAAQRQAGAVSESRQVSVEGHRYAASPNSGSGTPYYYPGGVVAGRPVPRGWYSEPWWKPALVAGAWGVGTFLLMDAMFSGMHGVGDYGMGDMGMGDMGGAADMGDAGGFDFGDMGGFDF